MKLEVFERLLNLNRNLDRVIMNLKHLESMPEFDKGSIELFTEEGETLRASVNRYIGERVVGEADKESVRLDAIRDTRKPPEEEEEP